MNKADEEMRPEHRREDLGKGVRGKYFAWLTKGSNLVLLNDKVAKVFPTGEAVNEALLGLLALTEQTAHERVDQAGRRTNAPQRSFN